MQRCFQGVLQRVLQDSDSDEVCRRKRFWLQLMPLCSALALVGVVQDRSVPERMSVTAFATCFVGCFGGLVYLLVTRRLPLVFMGRCAVFCTVGLLLLDYDYSARMASFRPWSWVVLVMDICLAFNLPRIYQMTSLMLTTVAIVTTYVEAAFRLGAWDSPITEASKGDAVELCRCADPPCGTGYKGLLAIASVLTILYGDFFATRNFADGLRSEQAKMVASVRLTERVAELLAAYATEDARWVVAQEGTALPEALLASFGQLLDNLDSYRAFLPDALLNAAQQHLAESTMGSALAEPAPMRFAPGLGQESAQVAMCFTDIQSSTELWESRPQGMYDGLNLHNKVMRGTYISCNGYEVKTIGDSFMVAFDSSADALRFGLEAQMGLLRQQWPEDLVSHPLCQRVRNPDGGLLWGGLRVRIGVQSGPARVERNPVTGRCDYFGPTVNTAARLEAVLRKGGLVATSDAVVTALGDAGLRLLGSPEARDAGARELKGVKQPVTVWALAPRMLAGRMEVLAADTSPPTSPSRPNSPSSIPQCRTNSLLSFGSNSEQAILWSPRGTRPVARITLRLSRTAATCAAARIALVLSEPVPQSVSVFAAAASLSADQTHGVVDSLLSANVFVSWNASRPCLDHAAACRRFLASNFRSRCHLGAASGSVLSGGLDAGRRSFATVAGGCVELAAALAEEAERCGDTALAACGVADDCVAAGAAFRAQLWQAPGHPDVVVWAVDVAQGGDKWTFSENEPSERAQGAEEAAAAVSDLFCKACAEVPGSDRQLAVLQELLQLEGSTAREHLVRRIRAGFVRSRPMPPLWDAGWGIQAVCVSPLALRSVQE